MASPVLIVGAGPSGLVLALTLLRNNVPVRIIEKQTRYQAGQRGSGIHSRILELYKFLGILSQVLEAGGPVQLIEQWVPRAKEPYKVIEMMAELENTPARPYSNALMLGQDRHEAILRSVLKKEFGCTVELGTELVSFEQHDDYVVAQMAKKLDGQTNLETERFTYLVGTDGAHSIVRKKLGLTFLGESIHSVSVVTGDIHMKGMDKKYWRMWGAQGGDRAVSLRPFETGEDCFNFLIAGSQEENERVLASREAVVEVIKEQTGRTDLEFGELIWMGLWRPNIRMVNKFGDGRVFVAGDAAHVHSPTGGQGMNSGVQDSFNLGWKLSLVYKGLSPSSLLESYSQERLPVIATMLNLSTELFHKTFGSNGTDGWVRGDELRQLGVNYRGSPVVVDHKYTDPEENSDPYRSGNDGSVRAGDRAPDAPGLVKASSKSSQASDATRFFDIFKPSAHTLILFAGNFSTVTEILKDVSAYPKDVIQTVVVYPQSVTVDLSVDVDYVLIDHDGHAYKNYAISERELSIVAVRPDGYIGGLVFQSEGLRSYLKNIFL